MVRVLAREALRCWCAEYEVLKEGVRRLIGEIAGLGLPFRRACAVLRVRFAFALCPATGLCRVCRLVVLWLANLGFGSAVCGMPAIPISNAPSAPVAFRAWPLLHPLVFWLNSSLLATLGGPWALFFPDFEAERFEPIPKLNGGSSLIVSATSRPVDVSSSRPISSKLPASTLAMMPWSSLWYSDAKLDLLLLLELRLRSGGLPVVSSSEKDVSPDSESVVLVTSNEFLTSSSYSVLSGEGFEGWRRAWRGEGAMRVVAMTAVVPGGSV
jgi:hypothetical protein